MRRKHTDGARGSDAGAAITHPASKPKVSKVMNPVGWDISWDGMLPVPWARFYIRPTCARHSGNVLCTQAAGYYASRLVSFRYNCIGRFPGDTAQNRYLPFDPISCFALKRVTRCWIHTAARSSFPAPRCSGPQIE